ncbi:MAG: isochorismatase family protein [Candidatus Marinimicrobia bacterium]|nr:isochorismatase family protein [Candidatus Neomarinimicrobiota bacterium]
MLGKQNTVFVIIDVQGKLARMMHHSVDLFLQLGILIEGARLLDIPIIWMEQLPEKLGPTVKEVSQHLNGVTPLSKDVFSCYRDESFREILNELKPDNVILAGIETHICVYQTAIDLIKSNYNVEIVTDATSTRNPENKIIGINKIIRAGGEETSVEMVLFEIQGKASGDTFRDLIRLLK